MPTERITIRDIAEKAGVSAGTVDRVLHNRPNVSKKSAAVSAAIPTAAPDAAFPLHITVYRIDSFAITAGSPAVRITPVLCAAEHSDGSAQAHRWLKRNSKNSFLKLGFCVWIPIRSLQPAHTRSCWIDSGRRTFPSWSARRW